jgi:hypothetical protein
MPIKKKIQTIQQASRQAFPSPQKNRCCAQEVNGKKGMEDGVSLFSLTSLGFEPFSPLESGGGDFEKEKKKKERKR